jgi:hypothetical protein
MTHVIPEGSDSDGRFDADIGHEMDQDNFSKPEEGSLDAD